MSTEENKALVRRWYDDMVNAGDLDVADEILSPGFVQHGVPPGSAPGPEGFKEFFMNVAGQAFSDLKVTVEDMVAEGDMVATRISAQATHRGTFRGYPGTGKPVTFTGMDFFKVSGGRLQERWLERSFLDMLEQSGVILPPEPMGQ